MKKACCKCKVVKPYEAFGPNKSRPDGVRRRCKDCRKANRNTPTGREIQNRQRRRVVRRNQLYILVYQAQNPCIDCGEADPRCLEFHHIDPSTKKANVSKMIQTCASLKAIKHEITKCQVLCSNCHRKKTSDEYSYYTSDKALLNIVKARMTDLPWAGRPCA